MKYDQIETKSRAHGSGKINTESKMYTESYHLYEIYANFKYDENGEPEEDFEDANSIIQLNRTLDIQADYSIANMKMVGNITNGKLISEFLDSRGFLKMKTLAFISGQL